MLGWTIHQTIHQGRSNEHQFFLVFCIDHDNEGTALKYALFIGAVASAIALFAFAGAGVADPNIPDVPPHQHFIITAEGEFIPIGPQVCPAGSSPQLQQAFNQFHLNIHHSFIPGVGAIDSLGPQDGAPGLHNQIGADMAGFPCSFVPPS